MIKRIHPWWIVEFPVGNAHFAPFLTLTLSVWSEEGKILRKEIEEWMAENFAHRRYCNFCIWGPHEYRGASGHWAAAFDYEEDAFLFELTWG